ncbi:MAG: methyltransferase [Saprospirales bacterium]|nr:methyltransferase [Saprospirales bacterium]
MMRWMYRRCWLPIYRRLALHYIRRERRFRFGGLRLTIPPGVFHPGVFFSTPIFLRYLETIDLQDKKILDIGTGSGVMALFAARKGARAAALDIHPLAVETARRNAATLQLQLAVWQSDLFDALPAQQFDYVLINPPYYPRTPETDAERAFFAGENLEYFEKLFHQLPDYIHAGSRIWMILSEDCHLEKIQEIAGRNGFSFSLVYQKYRWGERFEIWSIQHA